MDVGMYIVYCKVDNIQTINNLNETAYIYTQSTWYILYLHTNTVSDLFNRPGNLWWVEGITELYCLVSV